MQTVLKMTVGPVDTQQCTTRGSWPLLAAMVTGHEQNTSDFQAEGVHGRTARRSAKQGRTIPESLVIGCQVMTFRF